MIFTFQRVIEFSVIDTIFECYAKDKHDAFKKFLESGHNLDSYDLLAVNGEWI